MIVLIFSAYFLIPTSKSKSEHHEMCNLYMVPYTNHSDRRNSESVVKLFLDKNRLRQQILFAFATSYYTVHSMTSIVSLNWSALTCPNVWKVPIECQT